MSSDKSLPHSKEGKVITPANVVIRTAVGEMSYDGLPVCLWSIPRAGLYQSFEYFTRRALLRLTLAELGALRGALLKRIEESMPTEQKIPYHLRVVRLNQILALFLEFIVDTFWWRRMHNSASPSTPPSPPSTKKRGLEREQASLPPKKRKLA